MSDDATTMHEEEVAALVDISIKMGATTADEGIALLLEKGLLAEAGEGVYDLTQLGEFALYMHAEGR